jgi:TRAP-type mannitol/chloroaromatic compound transport system permease small subunit
VIWEKIARTIDWINHKVGLILAMVIFPILFIMLYEVVSRYIFDSPTSWAWRVNTLLFSGSLILGGGYVHLRRGHVSIDLITERLTPFKAKILYFVTFPAFLIFMIVIIWQGWRMAYSSVAIREQALGFFRPPLYYNKIAFVIAGVLLLLQGIAVSIHIARASTHTRDLTKSENTEDAKNDSNT